MPTMEGMKRRRGRPKLKLVVEAAQAAELRRRFRSCPDPKEKERLQTVLLALTGNYTHQQIAETVGRARSLIQQWVDRFEAGGLTELLRRGKAPGKPSELQQPEVQQALSKGLREGRWLTARQLAAWLRETHGIDRKARSLYYWLGKAGGVLKVPRPVHIKRDDAAAAEFQAHLYEKLCELDLPADRPVRVWVVDESRYGLHSFTRRCWSLRGVRVVKPSQQKYQWGYVYGALEVVEGHAEFRFMPSVNLSFLGDFLKQVAASAPEAEHVVIWDQAGFHPSPESPSLPAHIHLLPLPPYSPELNPVEKLWDVIKDALANRVFGALGRLERVLAESLRPYWTDTEMTRRLVGEGWMHTQANAS